MPAISNIFSGAILAPVVAILGAISLAALQRSIEWVSVVAKSPQKGYLRQLKPYFKHVDTIIERILAGNKFTITTTHILLMAVCILLVALLLETSEKPKRMVVQQAKKAEKSE